MFVTVGGSSLVVVIVILSASPAIFITLHISPPLFENVTPVNVFNTLKVPQTASLGHTADSVFPSPPSLEMTSSLVL